MSFQITVHAESVQQMSNLLQRLEVMPVTTDVLGMGGNPVGYRVGIQLNQSGGYESQRDTIQSVFEAIEQTLDPEYLRQ
ncbi:hypothetical protein [Thalassiella azotivora]